MSTARWATFEHRPSDIVVSTRSKTGTTLVQHLCALLVFQTPELPGTLHELSPWLDWSVESDEAVLGRLATQQHRRIIKTHTPLDALPLDPRVTYLVVGRHPLDVAVSLHHHLHNLDRAHMARLSGKPQKDPPPAALDASVQRFLEAPLGDDSLDTLEGLVHHVRDARERRGTADVLLLHHRDLVEHPERELRALAVHLGIAVPDDRWPALIEAASFASMRKRAARLAPGLDVLKDPTTFFRNGRPGGGASEVGPGLRDRYAERISALADPPLRAWLEDGATPRLDLSSRWRSG